MSLFYNETVRVLRPTTTTNRAQETVLNYAGLESAAGYPRAQVQVRPAAQAENVTDDRAVALSEWLLQTEPGSGDWDVRSTDWVRLPDGTIATVVGDAARPVDPLSGGLHHVQVRVRRAG